MMRAVDTSLLYAFFSDGDPHQAEAQAAFRQSTPLGIPTGILQETLDLIRYRKGKPAAVAAYEYLLSLPHVRLLETPPEPPVSVLWKENRSLSHADAAAVVTAWREGADLLTADAKQKAAFRRRQ